jgi:hypothetical protein
MISATAAAMPLAVPWPGGAPAAGAGDRDQEGDVMKAIGQDAYGSPDVLHLVDAEPPSPGEGEVLVRVHAAGVDPGVWHLVAGLP